MQLRSVNVPRATSPAPSPSIPAVWPLRIVNPSTVTCVLATTMHRFVRSGRPPSRIVTAAPFTLRSVTGFMSTRLVTA